MWVNFDMTNVGNKLKNKMNEINEGKDFKKCVCVCVWFFFTLLSPFSKILAHKINILSSSSTDSLQAPGRAGRRWLCPAAARCEWECVRWEQQSF